MRELIDYDDERRNIRVSKEIGKEIMKYYNKYGNNNLKRWKDYPRKP